MNDTTNPTEPTEPNDPTHTPTDPAPAPAEDPDHAAVLAALALTDPDGPTVLRSRPVYEVSLPDGTAFDVLRRDL